MPTGTTRPGAIEPMMTGPARSVGVSLRYSPRGSKRPDRLEQPTVRGEPNRGRLGEGQQNVRNLVGSPEGAGPDLRLHGQRGVEEREIVAFPGLYSERLGASYCRRLGDAACRDEAGRQAGHCCLPIAGKALFVPVESAQRGTSPHSRATRRNVPSPPRMTKAATPAARLGVVEHRGARDERADVAPGRRVRDDTDASQVP
jgi:hypothetical protein